MAGGMDETVATAESLRLTGDPYEIGTELDRVHRPKTPAARFMLAVATPHSLRTRRGANKGDILFPRKENIPL